MARCYSWRAAAFRGRYHVLGGVLSALDGVGPEALDIAGLVARAVEGQTTAHDIIDRLADTGVEITRPAHGVPVGGELDYLDDGTLALALKSRRPL